MQLTISAYLFGFAIGQIFYGPMSDRHGRKPVLLAALGIYCAASLACALSTSIEMLIAARALQALGGSGGIVLARAIVRDLYSGARAGRELSLIGSVMALAPVLAPIAGGVLQTGFGWRAIFFTLVAAGVLGAGIIWLLLPETLGQRAAEPVSPSSMLKSYRIVARNPAYLAYLGLASSSYAGLFAWISGASFVLQDLYRLHAVRLRRAFAVGSVGYMTGSALAARLVLKVGLDHTIGVGACFCASGGLVMMAARRARPDIRGVAGIASRDLSRRAGHGAAAVDCRRDDAVSGARRRGVVPARFRATERRGAMRGDRRCLARCERLAARRRSGGDGLRDVSAVDADARLRARVAQPR